MPLNIIKGDITKLSVDAIVNAANESLLGGGGVDGAIHKAAGPNLLEECRLLNGCKTGFAKITKGYNLPSKHVIHTVGPVYIDGNHGEEKMLRSAYRESLKLAEARGLQSIAFPLISAGVYGYPKDEAIDVAIDEIKNFLYESELEVFLVIYDQSIKASNNNYREIKNYLEKYQYRLGKSQVNEYYLEDSNLILHELTDTATEVIGDRISMMDKSFSEYLLFLIDERNMTDVECYKKANIDRKLFSKIRSNKDYRPKKETAIAFAIALELDMPETLDLISRAGYTMSNSSKFDIIIKYFIENEVYDVFTINRALFEFDQKLLGSF